jgi:hypothetical protein
MNIFRFFLGVALVSIFSQSSFAHERFVYQIADKPYIVVIGSQNEPIYNGDKSGIDLKVKLADPEDIGNFRSENALPVEGLADSLQAQVLVAGEVHEVELKAAYGKSGEYYATFYPQTVEAFSYRIYGKIDGVSFDQSYTCQSAGHVMGGEENTDVVVISEGVQQVFNAGSFGCPKDRSQVAFPLESNDSKSFPIDVFSGIALLISLLALWRTRRN